MELIKLFNNYYESEDKLKIKLMFNDEINKIISYNVNNNISILYIYKSLFNEISNNSQDYILLFIKEVFSIYHIMSIKNNCYNPPLIEELKEILSLKILQIKQYITYTNTDEDIKIIQDVLDVI